SHELRTPLNAIIGFSEVLKDEHFGPLTPKQKSYVKDILTSGKHLNSLIEDILNLTQIEKKTDALKLKPLDMVCFLENLFPLIREKTQKHFILPDLNISRKVAGLFVRADEQRLKQVMMDLVDNAVKFTPKRGKISIAAELILDSEDTICGKGAGENVSRKGAKAQSKINEFQSAGDNIQSSTNNIQSSIVNLQYIRVSVTDSGIGIAPGDQEKIFEDFFQIKGGLTDKTAGTGLGLSLVRRIIEMHGGRIWAKSFGEGKGSRFFFVIPVLEDIRKKEPKGANK
ncbi:MAG: HAMP domain-containing histidine kinase, partial [Desulfobacula sp.]|nr:HAMP domain-containing histidine kinase [Desulfobacula sp.]